MAKFKNNLNKTIMWMTAEIEAKLHDAQIVSVVSEDYKLAISELTAAQERIEAIKQMLAEADEDE